MAEQNDEELLHIETPTEDSPSPSTESMELPISPVSEQHILLQYKTLQETDVTLPPDLATDWNVLVSTQLHKPNAFPADLAPYTKAFRAVVRRDRQSEVLPLQTLLELEPCFRLCSHHYTPLYVLTKLCTVTSRRQFESYITQAVKKVQKPLFIVFLRHFIAYLGNFQNPTQTDPTTPQYLFAKAIYIKVMQNMHNNETDAPKEVFQKRMQRRAQKCLAMICDATTQASRSS